MGGGTNSFALQQKIKELENKLNHFKYTDVTMDVEPGSNLVPGITNINCIPVIMRVSMGYNGMGVYARAYGNEKWTVMSEYKQNITIRFLEYPE